MLTGSIHKSIALIQFTYLLAFTSSFSAMSMKSMRTTDNHGNKGIVQLPSSTQYQSVVIWMHGLGDTADGWAGLMSEFGLENTKFILPTAKNRPISLNGGMSMNGWSNIYGLSMNDEEDRAGFDESKERIDHLIQKEIDSGINPSKIVIAGFSQGGALALHTSLRSIHKLGGCIALSTWLPLRNDYPASLSTHASTLPLLQIHGDRDMIVSYQWGELSYNLLKTFITTTSNSDNSDSGIIAPKFIKIKGMGHSSDHDEIVAVKQFLQLILQ